MSKLTRDQIEAVERLLAQRRNEANRQRDFLKDAVNRKVPQAEEYDNELAKMRRTAIYLKGTSRAEALEKINSLVKQKWELIQRETGLTEDDIINPYTCKLCRDTGYLENEKCSCRKALEAQVVNEDSGIQGFLPEIGIEGVNTAVYDDNEPLPETDNLFTTRGYIEECIVPDLKEFVENFGTGANLLLTGSVGTGKTFLSSLVAKSLSDRGYTVIYSSAEAVIENYQSSMSPNSETFGKACSFIDSIENCDLLILDDLGTERSTDYAFTRIFDLINKRIGKRLSTIISTNLSIEDIRGRYDDRVASRIDGCYQTLDFFGEDLRIKIRKKSDQTNLQADI